MSPTKHGNDNIEKIGLLRLRECTSRLPDGDVRRRITRQTRIARYYAARCFPLDCLCSAKKDNPFPVSSKFRNVTRH